MYTAKDATSDVQKSIVMKYQKIALDEAKNYNNAVEYIRDEANKGNLCAILPQNTNMLVQKLLVYNGFKLDTSAGKIVVYWSEYL